MRNAIKMIHVLLVLVVSMLGHGVAVADVITYYHTDISGSPIAGSDVHGNIVWREAYTPYGERRLEQASSGGNRRWFTGQPHEEFSGLTYMGARHYDPMIGRFMGVDPAGVDAANPHSFSRYAYANNNPYRFVDLNGRAACPAGEKGCYDNPRTETGKETQGEIGTSQRLLDSRVSEAQSAHQLSDGTELNFSARTNDEQGFGVSDKGTYSNPMQLICWTCTDGSKGVGGIFNFKALAPGDSGGHTHPRGALGDVDPLPGPKDGGLARELAKLGASSYVISDRGAFAVELTPVGFRVRQIAGGSLTSSEATAVRKLIGDWNKHSGSGGGQRCSYGACK